MYYPLKPNSLYESQLRDSVHAMYLYTLIRIKGEGGGMGLRKGKKGEEQQGKEENVIGAEYSGRLINKTSNTNVDTSKYLIQIMTWKVNPKHSASDYKGCVWEQLLFVCRNLPYTETAREIQWL